MLGGMVWGLTSLRGQGQLRGNGVSKDLVTALSKQSDIFREEDLWRYTSYRYEKRSRPCTVIDKCLFQTIADLDHKSKIDGRKPLFKSHLLTGELWEADGKVNVSWRNSGQHEEVISKYNEAGRGLELSDLTLFNDSLLTYDDRTGVVFALLHKGTPPRPYVLPLQVVVEGNGISSEKGQKIEWATEKDGQLWIGSFGKEFTTNGEVVNMHNMWVAVMDKKGSIRRRDWTPVYTRLRERAGAGFPGYLIHEAARWSSYHRKWFFLPRRVSSEPYDEERDNFKGSNIMLVASEDFDHIDIVHIDTPVIPERGFSAFTFMPGTHDKIIVALKSEEDLKTLVQRSFITAFDVNGSVLLEDSLLPDASKYEGIEVFSRKEVGTIASQ